MIFIPPPGAFQVAVNLDWNTNAPCEEFPVWVVPFHKLCPYGKRGFTVIDPQYRDGSGLLCECHVRIIE